MNDGAYTTASNLLSKAKAMKCELAFLAEMKSITKSAQVGEKFERWLDKKIEKAELDHNNTVIELVRYVRSMASTFEMNTFNEFLSEICPPDENLKNEDFNIEGNPRQWQVCVMEEIRDAWPELTARERRLVYIIARDQVEISHLEGKAL